MSRASSSSASGTADRSSKASALSLAGAGIKSLVPGIYPLIEGSPTSPAGSSSAIPLVVLPGITLAGVLRGETQAPVSLEDFREFLIKDDHGAETLDYYLAVEHYKLVDEDDSESGRRSSFLTPSLADLRERDRTDILDFIVHQFIRPGAPEEIMMSPHDREKILHSYDDQGDCALDVLLASQRQCYDFLLTTSFPRFQHKATTNIGPAEVSFRLHTAVLMALVTVALIALSLTLPAIPRPARWAIFLPATLAPLNVLQWRSRFCVVYSARGLARWRGFGLMGFLRKERNTVVKDRCLRRAHRRRSLTFTGLSILFGAAVAGVVYAIPVNIHKPQD